MSKSKVTEIEADYSSSEREVEGDLTDIGSDWIEVDDEQYDLSSDFDEENDISGGVDDYDELRDRFDDDDESFIIELTLDSRGEVISIDAQED